MSPPRPTITLSLTPEPGVELPRGLRATLKRLLRTHGPRCMSMTVEGEDGDHGQHSGAIGAEAHRAATIGGTDG